MKRVLTLTTNPGTSSDSRIANKHTKSRIHQTLLTLALLCPLALSTSSALAAPSSCQPEINFRWADLDLATPGGIAYVFQRPFFILDGTCLYGSFNKVELARDFEDYSQFEDLIEHQTVADAGDPGWLLAYHNELDRQVLLVDYDIPRDHWNDGGQYQLRLLNCAIKGGTERCTIVYKTFLSKP